MGCRQFALLGIFALIIIGILLGCGLAFNIYMSMEADPEVLHSTSILGYELPEGDTIETVIDNMGTESQPYDKTIDNIFFGFVLVGFVAFWLIVHYWNNIQEEARRQEEARAIDKAAREGEKDRRKALKQARQRAC